MKFFNEDAKIKYGGRNAVKLTVDELKALIEEKYFNKYNDKGAFEHEDFDDMDYSYKMFILLQTLLAYEPSLVKDRKYSFDTENLIADPNETTDTFTGYHTLDNGLTYLGFFAGGDWELAVYGAIYYDGKNLRLFQPTRGNAVNRKTKEAFGNHSWDEDEEVAVNDYGFDDYEAFGEASTDLYNDEAMIEELKARVEVK